MSLDAFIGKCKKGEFSPLYALYGGETLFVEKALDAITGYALDESTRSFNYDVIMGPDAQANALIALARSYPVMAPRRLVVVKEAHRIRKEHLDKLAGYWENPAPTTVMVLVFGNANGPDKRAKWGQLLHKKAALFEGKSLRDKEAVDFLAAEFAKRKVNAPPEIAQLIPSLVGTDARMLQNAAESIELYLADKPDAQLNKEVVYACINVDREFNVFELINHIGARNAVKAQGTLHYLTRNPRENPGVAMVAQLYGFFARVAQAQDLGHAATEHAVGQALGLPPFIAKQYADAAKRYTPAEVRDAIRLIRDADLTLKGVGNSRMDEAHTLKTLVYKLVA